MTCAHCTQQGGTSIYPMYGVAPHKCFYKTPGKTLGESELVPKEEWPSNFKEDPEVPGCGVYLWCMQCGEGKPDE